MATTDAFPLVTEELKAIFIPYLKWLDVVYNKKSGICLNTRHIMKNKQPLFFGGVRMGKSYVSFHLMALYCFPEMKASISASLRRHMQGKSCFNFTSADKKLFKELRGLTKSAFARFKSERFL